MNQTVLRTDRGIVIGNLEVLLLFPIDLTVPQFLLHVPNKDG